ncbi:asparagine synthase (glutamine-hydrolyzing) [Amphibacillus sediminis]|uniref:asparagine synthase (glutamine-hydrolyzing) n=1 Tax=Amphibacillus sediminis TaxID=360185 RepID=UPI0008314C17|nr:asparagine synthase (glutamine-hydrolyzing) [Amphibacillus sediminis]
MCGFYGILRHQKIEVSESDQLTFKEATRLITHRGPDDQGYFEDAHISLGFRRLSIIDLENGHQPFLSEDGRYAMVFNGEVYNYIELRDQLANKGHTFQTDSDTEVVLKMFITYREEAFKFLRGMFAIIIWDKESETLFGARDRFGIKPLYYRASEHGLQFASERKSLLTEQSMTLDQHALQHYFSFQYVPEPATLDSRVKKLEPGHYFVQPINQSPTFKCYWKASFSYVNREKDEWINRVREAIIESVGIHMRSDVPVGSFLSGGIDSSFIVAAAKQFNPNIKTFSVGFEHEGFSEIDVAQQTADALNVNNDAYVITPQEYIDNLPEIVWHMDDPLADPACVPLYFVARQASQEVKVVLSGEGADELFGGYNIYREPESIKIFNYIPDKLKKLLNQLAQVIPEGMKGKSYLERGTTPLALRYIGNAKMFEAEELKKLYLRYDEQTSYQQVTAPLYQEIESYDPVNKMQYIDIHTWLRGDILLKADRMTMAHSLELRVPFLDKEVFDVAQDIPVDLKIAQGTTKQILREAAKGIVPEHVLNRRKLGFPVPIRHWLKNEMHDWAISIIKESETDHLINKPYILDLLAAHCQEKGDYSRKIWTVLIFMIWHQIFVEGKDSQINHNKSKLTV